MSLWDKDDDIVRARDPDRPHKVHIDEDERGITITVDEARLFHYPKTRELSVGERRSLDALIAEHKRYNDWLNGQPVGWCGYCDSSGRIAFINDGLPQFKCPRCGGTSICTCEECRAHFRRTR